MMASPEMQAWLGRMQGETKKLGKRNKYLAAALAVGMLVLLIIVWGIYAATIGAYAVIDQIEITQDPIQQGRLLIKFRVVSPGKVYCQRVCGRTEIELIDTFNGTCQVERPWSWTYEPGKDIDVKIWYRGSLLRRTFSQSFPTASRADIVVIMDTTGSMSPSISELKAKCVAFSDKLRKQALKHRFALIGFGDSNEGTWLDKHDFTSDVSDFIQSVDKVKRFDGGDFPESGLDALEAALSLPLDEAAIHRFYLVTDAEFHQPSRTGATAQDIANKLEEKQVLLRVFSRPEFEKDYQPLLGRLGRFQEIENFGKVLSAGRVLED